MPPTYKGCGAAMMYLHVSQIYNTWRIDRKIYFGYFSSIENRSILVDILISRNLGILTCGILRRDRVYKGGEFPLCEVLRNARKLRLVFRQGEGRGLAAVLPGIQWSSGEWREQYKERLAYSYSI